MGSCPKTVRINAGLRRTRCKPVEPPSNLPGSRPQAVEESSGSEDPADPSPAHIELPENPDLIYAHTRAPRSVGASAVRSVPFLEPLDERPSRLQPPKKPSAVHRPMSESRSRPVNERQRCFRDPKIPSTARRLTSAPRLEPVSEPPDRLQAPKSPSPNHRLTSKPREADRRASTSRPGSEEPFRGVHPPT